MEQLLVRLDMAVEIHADEAVELQEARIDVAHEAGIRKRHLGDDVAAEPVDAALFGERIDGGRIDPRIDRSAHQDHGGRHIGIVVRLHERDRGHDRHRRLADRDHMGVAAERVQDRDQVVDVIVEIEASFRQRHHARIDPVGDVDVVVGQKRLDRAAQQRCVMARHRRDDQQPRLRPFRTVLEHALEMDELAERPLPDRRDMHRHALAADQRRGDAPFRPAVAARRALEQFASRSDRFSERGEGQRIDRVLEEQPRGVGPRPRRIERRMAHLVEPVQRRRRAKCHCRPARQARRQTLRWPWMNLARLAAVQHCVDDMSCSQYKSNFFSIRYASGSRLPFAAHILRPKRSSALSI